MIRALYTAASGMNAQQTNIDNTAHNLANVNTTGFKKARVEFEDLVYQQVRGAGIAELDVDGDADRPRDRPRHARRRHRARLRHRQPEDDQRPARHRRRRAQGFFQVTLPDGRTAYTRDGAFHTNAEGGMVTAEGYPLEPAITIPADATSVSISKEGVVSVTIAGQNAAQQLGTIELATFQNPPGLTPLGGNFFAVTTASGEATTGAPGTEGLGTIQQGFLEESNVSIVEEMINMILAPARLRGELAVVKTADEMLAQVNNLAR